jgi:hypothetical protein
MPPRRPRLEVATILHVPSPPERPLTALLAWSLPVAVERQARTIASALASTIARAGRYAGPRWSSISTERSPAGRASARRWVPDAVLVTLARLLTRMAHRVASGRSAEEVDRMVPGLAVFGSRHRDPVCRRGRLR